MAGTLGSVHLGAPPWVPPTEVEGFTKMTVTWSSLRQNGSKLTQEKALNELHKLLESGKQMWEAQPFCTFIQWRLFSRVWWPSLVANGQGMTKIWAVKARGLIGLSHGGSSRDATGPRESHCVHMVLAGQERASSQAS